MRVNKQETDKVRSDYSKTNHSDAFSSSKKNKRKELKQQRYENKIKEKYGNYYLQNIKNREIANEMAKKRKFNKKEAERALRQYVIDAKRAIKQQERLEYFAQKEFEDKAYADYLRGQRLARLAAERARKQQMHREIEMLLLKAAEKAKAKQDAIERKQYELTLKLKNKEFKLQLKLEEKALIEASKRAYQEELAKAKQEAERIEMLRRLNNQRIRDLNLESESYLAKKEALIEQEKNRPLLEALARKQEVAALLKQARLIAKEEYIKQRQLERHEAALKKEADRKEALRQKELERKRKALEHQKELARRQAEHLEKIHLRELAEIEALRQKELKRQEVLHNNQLEVQKHLAALEKARELKSFKIAQRNELVKQRFEIKRNELELKALHKAAAELEAQRNAEERKVADMRLAQERALQQKKLAEEIKRIEALKAEEAAKLKAIKTAEIREQENNKKLQEQIRLMEKRAKARAKIIADLNKARELENERLLKKAEKAAREQLRREEKMQRYRQMMANEQARVDAIETQRLHEKQENVHEIKEQLEATRQKDLEKKERREIILEKKKESEMQKREDAKQAILLRMQKQRERAKEEIDNAKLAKEKAQAKLDAKKAKAAASTTFTSVYHLVPRNNGKNYHLMRMGAKEVIKVFNKQEVALEYIDKYIMKDAKTKVYIHDLKNHIKLYKKKAK